MTMHLDERYALLDVTVVDGLGHAPKEGMAVLVDRGDIAAVVPMADYRRRPDLQEVDCHGHFVTPGLIDAHVHMAGGRAGMEDQELGVLMEPKLVRAVRSVAEAQALLKRGFTAVRDISWNGLYLKRVFREGSLPGPRVIACGPGLCRTGGHGDAFQYEEDYVVRNHFWAVLADGPDEIRKWVRRLLREGADQIKVWASGGDNWANDRNRDQHYTLEELQVAVAEAHMQKGTLVCSHAENLQSARDSVTAGADTIEHGEELDEALCEEMAARGVILVPTLELLVTWFTDFAATTDAPIEHVRPQVFLHRDVDDIPDADSGRRYARQVIDNFRMAKEKGVKIALGSDTVFTPLTPYGEYSAREFRALVRHGGMTTLEAIEAATHTAAEALGMAHRLGSVEAGKAADLLVVSRDPASDPEVLYDAANIRWVIGNGRLAVEDGRLAY
jgi:imidazolonepropionase-like amidohydrolase